MGRPDRRSGRCDRDRHRVTNDFASIAQLCRDLLLGTAAPERVRFMRSISSEIGKSQPDRIAAQRNSEGAAPSPLRPKPDRAYNKGRLRQQKMFRNIRTAKSPKAGGNADEAYVALADRHCRLRAYTRTVWRTRRHLVNRKCACMPGTARPDRRPSPADPRPHS